jgi:hypothetical protein
MKSRMQDFGDALRVAVRHVLEKAVDKLHDAVDRLHDAVDKLDDPDEPSVHTLYLGLLDECEISRARRRDDSARISALQIALRDLIRAVDLPFSERERRGVAAACELLDLPVPKRGTETGGLDETYPGAPS